MSNQSQDSSIILYQPYYNSTGHFKDFFHLYDDYLIQNGQKIYGVIGTFSGKTDGLNEERIKAFKSYSGHRFKRIIVNYAGFRQVKNLLHLRKVKAIHFLDYEILSLSSYLMSHRKTFQKAKIVLTQHSVNNLTARTYANPLLKGYHKLARKAFQFLDQNFDLTIVTNGEWITRSLRNFYRSDNTRFVTSTWGAHPPVGFKDKTQAPFNSFLYLGIIRKDKNLEYLLGQFAKIQSSYKLTIAGKPLDYTEKEIRDLVESSGIPEKQVELNLGYIDYEKYLNYLASNQYLVLPYNSSNKSNSGPLIQAIQYECIPIVSNYGERGRIVESNECGYTFKFEAENALSHLIDEIILNSKDKQKANLQIYQNKLREIKPNFQWENILHQQIQVKQIYD